MSAIVKVDDKMIVIFVNLIYIYIYKTQNRILACALLSFY
jgi:hypothetical protein